MTNESQRIQQQGRIFQVGQETGIIEGKCCQGEGEATHTGAKKYSHGPKPPTNGMREFPRYWMSEEIHMHDNRKVFPDWTSVGTKIIHTSKRDYKEARARRKEAANAQKREYRQRPECKARAAERQREKMQRPEFRVRKNLGKRLWDVLTQAGDHKRSSVMNYVGCTKDQLMRHLESKFKRGMTWGNYGTYWHVDHILPCASFDHTNERQIAQCWHWTNLQPMRATDNIIKSDTITEPQMNLLLCVNH